MALTESQNNGHDGENPGARIILQGKTLVSGFRRNDEKNRTDEKTAK